MPSSPTHSTIRETILQFAKDSGFPEGNLIPSLDVSIANLDHEIAALDAARTEIHAHISASRNESSQDIASWIRHANVIQDDVVTTKALAVDILRLASKQEDVAAIVLQAQQKVELLKKEVLYNQQLLAHLDRIRALRVLIDLAQRERDNGLVLRALDTIDRARTGILELSPVRHRRVVALLSQDCSELSEEILGIICGAFHALVCVDSAAGSLSISNSIEGLPMALSDTVVGLVACNQVRETMERLWHYLDNALITPRMSRDHGTVHGFVIDEDSIARGDETEFSLKRLFEDIEMLLIFLSARLPSELMPSLCQVMMPDITSKFSFWVEPLFPFSPRDLDAFDAIIASVTKLLESLRNHGLTDLETLEVWNETAPRKWIQKCKETVLDNVRQDICFGIGIHSKRVELETGISRRAASPEVSTDAGHSTDIGLDKRAQDEIQEDHKAWDAEGGLSVVIQDKQQLQSILNVEVDQGDNEEAAAWADEELADGAGSNELDLVRNTPGVYYVSGIPDALLELIRGSIADAEILQQKFTRKDLATTVRDYFAMPYLVLSIFRAMAPQAYARANGGNMFLHNDAMFLANKLTELALTWNLSPMTTGSVSRSNPQLADEAEMLKTFARRSWETEINIQTTVLHDLLGGAYGVLHQEQPSASVDAAVDRILSLSSTWKLVLTPTSWANALGALMNLLADKLVQDVMDLSSIDPDQTSCILDLLRRTERVEPLLQPTSTWPAITPPRASTEPASASWAKLGYLRQLLLADQSLVHDLWFHGELSVHFSASQVVDLAGMIFAPGVATKGLVRDIRLNPDPLPA